MRYLLACLGFLFFSQNAFADGLTCNAGAGLLTQPIQQGQAQVGSDSFDASLSPGSIFFAVQDPVLHHRAAFTGSSLSFSPDGALLETSTAHTSCLIVPEHLSLAPPAGSGQKLDYLACAVDIAQFTDGTAESATRHLVKLTSPIHSTFPLDVRGEDAVVAFHVQYLSYNPIHGLDLTLTDKESGEVAHYNGPARSLQKSFLLGLTIGDRAVSARFLRLGCVWTNDPKALAQ